MCGCLVDDYIDSAKKALAAHFVNSKGDPIKTPYYQRQLQVLYENRFFEWVVSKALKELVNEGRLEAFDKERIPALGDLKIVSGIKFYTSPESVVSDRDKTAMTRRILNMAKIVEKYSGEEHNAMLGKHLEILVKTQLQILQFKIEGTHTRKYGENEWSDTAHTLDFIAKRKNLAIGVEVKNELGVMDPEEIDTKIDMCSHLGLIPIFAVRWIKPYIECIRQQGGFGWMFKTQILPLGQEKLAHAMFTKFSALHKKDGLNHRLEFPVSVKPVLPPKSVKRFESWIEGAEKNPPEVDTDVRCVR